MERCVTFTVDASGGVTPTAPQYAGVQGEHNACRVTFSVAAWAGEKFHYRGEFVSGDGAGGSTDELPVKNGQVSLLLPAAWTAAGGRAVVRLVASVLSDNEEEQTVFAVDAPVYFAAKQELGEEIRDAEMAGLTSLIQAVHDTVEDVEVRLARGDFKGDKGDTGPTGPIGPKGKPWVYVGSGEMPEGYDVQIDPDGDGTPNATLRIAVAELMALVSTEVEFDLLDDHSVTRYNYIKALNNAHAVIDAESKTVSEVYTAYFELHTAIKAVQAELDCVAFLDFNTTEVTAHNIISYSADEGAAVTIANVTDKDGVTKKAVRGGGNLHLRLDLNVIISAEGTNNTNFKVTVTYLDTNKSVDAADGRFAYLSGSVRYVDWPSTSHEVAFAEIKNTGKWVTTTFTLRNADFVKGAGARETFMLQMWGMGNQFAISSVKIEPEQAETAEPTAEERLAALEAAMLEQIMGVSI